MKRFFAGIRRFLFATPLERMLTRAYLLPNTPTSFGGLLRHLIKNRYNSKGKLIVFGTLDLLWITSLIMFWTLKGSLLTFLALFITTILFATTCIFSGFSIFGGASVLGIALGVMSLFVTDGIQRGTLSAFKNRHFAVMPDAVCTLEELPKDLILESYKIVKQTGNLFSPTQNKFTPQETTLWGISPDQTRYITALQAFLLPQPQNPLLDPKILFQQNSPQVYKLFIGKLMADSLGLSIGDTLVILHQDYQLAEFSGFKIIKKESPFDQSQPKRTFEIAGIFQTGINILDQYLGFTTVSALKNLLSVDIEQQIWLSSKGKNAPLPSGCDQTLFQRSFSESEKMIAERAFLMNLVMALLIILASFNLLSGVAVFLADKSKHIAMLKALGMQELSIQRLFRQIGLRLGAAGIFIGIFMGYLIGTAIKHIPIELDQNVYPMKQLFFSTSALSVAITIGLSGFIVHISLLFAGRKTAKIPIAETFQKEEM